MAPAPGEITAHHGPFKDTNLHVDDTGGTGRPVLLVHGWPLSGEAWSEQVPALERAGYRVITHDRRGFGRSDKPSSGYDYDTCATDLLAVLEGLDLTGTTLVGFSTSGGEVARHLGDSGHDRVRSVVFAAAVPPYLAKTDGNPEGPLTQEEADEMESGLKSDEASSYDSFTTDSCSVDGELEVSEEQRQEAVALCRQADHKAALKAMEAFGTTDFREVPTRVDVPTLVIHGDGDGVVPFEGSGARTHAAIAGSQLHVIAEAPHGCNASHADESNRVLIDFLAR